MYKEMISQTQYFLSASSFSKSEISEKIADLRGVLEYHSQKYYADNNPEISDEEFDILFHLLKKWERDFPHLKEKKSPTEKIVGGISSGFKKAKHLVPMISLDNAFSEEDLQDWEKRFQKILEKNMVETNCNSSLRKFVSFIVEPKFDGLGISCVYENGKLVRAVTRGDGEEGENVTENILTIPEIPREISGVPKLFEVRGEVVMKKSDFETLNTQLEKDGKKVFSNPRNAAAGSLRQLDSTITKSRKLSVFFYQSPLEHKNYSEILSFFDTKNIPHSPYFSVCKNIAEVSSAIQKISELRETFDFEIDGAVVKVNEVELQTIIGSTGHHPRWAIAWKFPATKVKTRLKNVEWQVGRTGTLTPVAHLDPVNIDGVMVSRATLHNADYIAEKNLKIGDIVTLERSGEVIPKILFPHLSDRTGQELEISIPTQCPNCDSPVKKTEGEVAIKCVNAQCSEILKYSLFHFASKKAMNITGLGKEVAEKIIEQQLIEKISDLYTLSLQNFLEIEGFQEKSAKNLFSAIQHSRKNDLWRLINAFGIPLVGVKTAKILAKEFGSLQKISEASIEQLSEISDVGEKGAISITQFFLEKSAIIDDFQKIFTEQQTQKKSIEQIFSGKTFVFTGSLQKFSRDEAGDLVEERGGKMLSSVSKKLDFLVYGEKAGSKKTKAEDLGISLLTEEAFLEKCEIFQNPEKNDSLTPRLRSGTADKKPEKTDEQVSLF